MVTKEEIKKAKEVDLVDLVESLGFRCYATIDL